MEEVKDEFLNKLYNAFTNANGDLWEFWRLMNPETTSTVRRSATEKKVYIFCNKRKKQDGTIFLKRIVKIENVCFDVYFNTGTAPKYSGYILLKDYMIDETKKSLNIYKFEFLSAPTKEKEELPF